MSDTALDTIDELPPRVIGFWSWLFRKDRHGDRGLANVINRWLAFHLILAGVGAAILPVAADTLARSAALPGAALLVGLSFGWAGRSAGLLQDKDFSAFIIDHGPPAEGYIYSFQLAILAVLVFVAVAVLIAAGGLPLSSGSVEFDGRWNRFWLIFLGSLAVRECWGVIHFVNKMTIQFYHVRAIARAKARAEQAKG